MIITDAKYIVNENDENVLIEFTEGGNVKYIPVNSVGNTHYDEIMRQLDAGTLTIADAD